MKDIVNCLAFSFDYYVECLPFTMSCSTQAIAFVHFQKSLGKCIASVLSKVSKAICPSFLLTISRKIIDIFFFAFVFV